MKKWNRFLVASGFVPALVSCGGGDNWGGLGFQKQGAKLHDIAPFEDCVGFSYANATVKMFGAADYRIVDGNHALFAFGANKVEAERALQILKMYRMGHSCFVGRPGPSMTYQLTAQGAVAAQGESLVGEDCISFNNANTKVQFFPNLRTYKIVDGTMWMLDFGMNSVEANKALQVIKRHGFDKQCFVGRPDPSFAYWKKSAGIALRAPDLGAYGFLKIGERETLVRWNETVVLRPGDQFLISNGIPAFNLHYSDKNYGVAAASGFRNAWYLDGVLVSQQTNRSLAPGEKKDIATQAYLRASPGTHVLELRIDADNAVSESRENNNVFSVKVQFQGF